MKLETDPDLTVDACRVIAVSMMQSVIFVVLYEASAEIYESNFGEMSKIFGFEMEVDLALFLMSILAGANSVVQIFARNVASRMVSPLVCSVVWILYWGNIADVAPRRIVLLSAIGMIAFYVGSLLTYRKCRVPQVEALSDAPFCQ